MDEVDLSLAELDSTFSRVIYSFHLISVANLCQCRENLCDPFGQFSHGRPGRFCGTET
jgi:hypothetical protein